MARVALDKIETFPVLTAFNLHKAGTAEVALQRASALNAAFVAAIESGTTPVAAGTDTDSIKSD
jgi:hypothetical protein